MKKHIVREGVQPQLDLAQEEMAELIKDISKNRRGMLNQRGLAEETADVIICVSQIYSLMPEIVDKHIEKKINERIRG